MADDSLSLHGEVFRPVKQMRLLITSSGPERIKSSLFQRLGRNITILIVPIDAVAAWHIFGPGKPREWRNFVRAVEAAGIDVEGLSRDTDSLDIQL